MRIVREPRGVRVSLCYAVEKRALEPSAETVGIDVGVRSRITLSDGTVWPTARLDWQAILRQQRAVSRCQRGSRTRRKRVRRLVGLRERAKVWNRNACHRASRRIVRRAGGIAVEALWIRNMTASAHGPAQELGRNVGAKARLNRSILAQTWGILRDQLRYKAEWARVALG